MTMIMTISKSKLKAQALQVFRQLEKQGGEVIVTDHGKATLILRPIEKSMREMFPLPVGIVTGLDSLNEPTDAEWENL